MEYETGPNPLGWSHHAPDALLITRLRNPHPRWLDLPYIDMRIDVHVGDNLAPVSGIGVFGDGRPYTVACGGHLDSEDCEPEPNVELICRWANGYTGGGYYWEEHDSIFERCRMVKVAFDGRETTDGPLVAMTEAAGTNVIPRCSVDPAAPERARYWRLGWHSRYIEGAMCWYPWQGENAPFIYYPAYNR